MNSTTGYRKGTEKREQILLAIDEKGGEANTSDIREMTGIQTNVIGYHMAVLLGERDGPYGDDPVVKRDGQEQLEDAPIPANVYSLTEAGKEKVVEIRKEGEQALPSYKSLERELAELRRNHKQLRQDYEELRAEYQEVVEEQEWFRKQYNELLKRMTEKGLLD